MGTIYNMVKWYKGWCSHLHRTEPRGATVQPDSDIPAAVGFVCHALIIVSVWCEGNTSHSNSPAVLLLYWHLHEQCVGTFAIRLWGKPHRCNLWEAAAIMGFFFPEVNNFSLGKIPSGFVHLCYQYCCYYCVCLILLLCALSKLLLQHIVPAFVPPLLEGEGEWLI